MDIYGYLWIPMDIHGPLILIFSFMSASYASVPVSTSRWMSSPHGHSAKCPILFCSCSSLSKISWRYTYQIQIQLDIYAYIYIYELCLYHYINYIQGWSSLTCLPSPPIGSHPNPGSGWQEQPNAQLVGCTPRSQGHCSSRGTWAVRAAVRVGWWRGARAMPLGWVKPWDIMVGFMGFNGILWDLPSGKLT